MPKINIIKAKIKRKHKMDELIGTILEFHMNHQNTTSATDPNGPNEEIRQLFNRLYLALPRLIMLRRNPFNVYLEEQFKNIYGVSKATVIQLSDLVCSFNSKLVPLRGRGGIALSVMEQIFLALGYYANGCFKNAIYFKVQNPTAFKILNKVSKEIVKIAENKIYTLGHTEDLNFSDQNKKFFDLTGFPDVDGCVDSTLIPIQHQNTDELEPYKNKRGTHSVNVQVLCDADLRIRDICHSPGSNNGTTLYNDSSLRTQQENKEFDGYILGDEAYPCTEHLLTPFPKPSTDAERRYNEAHHKTMETTKKTITLWKKRFQCLTKNQRLPKIKHNFNVIMATVVVHNMAINNNDQFDIDSDLEDDGIDDIEESPAATDEGTRVRQSLVDKYFS